MTILLHKPYFVKNDHEGGRGSKIPKKFDHVVYGCPLSISGLYSTFSDIQFLLKRLSIFKNSSLSIFESSLPFILSLIFSHSDVQGRQQSEELL